MDAIKAINAIRALNRPATLHALAKLMRPINEAADRRLPPNTGKIPPDYLQTIMAAYHRIESHLVYEPGLALLSPNMGVFTNRTNKPASPETLGASVEIPKPPDSEQENSFFKWCTGAY